MSILVEDFFVLPTARLAPSFAGSGRRSALAGCKRNAARCASAPSEAWWLAEVSHMTAWVHFIEISWCFDAVLPLRLLCWEGGTVAAWNVSEFERQSLRFIIRWPAVGEVNLSALEPGTALWGSFERTTGSALLGSAWMDVDFGQVRARKGWWKRS